jgi:hypothetical protein
VGRATSPQSLAQVILSKPVVEEIRKELWRRSSRRLDADVVTSILRSGVTTPEALA